VHRIVHEGVDLVSEKARLVRRLRVERRVKPLSRRELLKRFEPTHVKEAVLIKPPSLNDLVIHKLE
jgi:hypothetical protein